MIGLRLGMWICNNLNCSLLKHNVSLTIISGSLFKHGKHKNGNWSKLSIKNSNITINIKIETCQFYQLLVLHRLSIHTVDSF